MIEYEPGDLFAWSLYRAIKTIRTWGPIPDTIAPEPEPKPSLALDTKLPPGVARHARSGKILAYVSLPRIRPAPAGKVVFPILPPTQENIDRCARVAWAARRCRDAGGDADAIKAAGMEEFYK